MNTFDPAGDANQPFLIVEAAAGSGKTHLLVERIVALLASGAAPGGILAISFTTKAAAELRDRVHQRLHQRVFRIRVIDAYATSCAICRLRYRSLLDAAHILPDGHPRGNPVVPNGLALCKIHHAAYDANYLGVRPDFVVEVRRDVRDAADGPMLLHGLQEMAGVSLTLPKTRSARPDPTRLEERYELFRRAS